MTPTAVVIVASRSGSTRRPDGSWGVIGNLFGVAGAGVRGAASLVGALLAPVVYWSPLVILLGVVGFVLAAPVLAAIATLERAASELTP
jgi:hypothetical protein